MWQRKKKKVQTTLDAYIVKPKNDKRQQRFSPQQMQHLQKHQQSSDSVETVDIRSPLQQFSQRNHYPEEEEQVSETEKSQENVESSLTASPVFKKRIIVRKKADQSMHQKNKPTFVNESLLNDIHRSDDDKQKESGSIEKPQCSSDEITICINDSPALKVICVTPKESPSVEKMEYLQGSSSVITIDDSPVLKDSCHKPNKSISSSSKSEEPLYEKNDNSLINNDSIFNDSYHRPIKYVSPTKFKYKCDAVRKKDERQKLCGYACHCCKNYFDALDLTPEEKLKRINYVSRHRDRQEPPHTPEGFWEKRNITNKEKQRKKRRLRLRNEFLFMQILNPRL